MTDKAELTDHEIVTLLKGKDMSAFDVIFKKYYQSLCFFASKIVKDNFEAQDIVQDVFVKFWQKELVSDSLNSIRAYLYVSVKNSCFNKLEKNSVKLKYQQTHPNADIEDATILNNIIQAELLRQVFATVDTLPEQCRKIIRMTFEEGKKAKEIASELNLTVSTVNNQKMRGLSLIKTRLEDDGFALGTLLLLPALLYYIK